MFHIDFHSTHNHEDKMPEPDQEIPLVVSPELQKLITEIYFVLYHTEPDDIIVHTGDSSKLSKLFSNKFAKDNGNVLISDLSLAKSKNHILRLKPKVSLIAFDIPYDRDFDYYDGILVKTPFSDPKNYAPGLIISSDDKRLWELSDLQKEFKRYHQQRKTLKFNDPMDEKRKMSYDKAMAKKILKDYLQAHDITPTNQKIKELYLDLLK